MKKPFLVLVAGILLGGIFSGQTTRKDNNIMNDYTDWHTQSNAKDINPQHLSLDIAVDFVQHQIKGSATWDLNPKPETKYAIFDTRKMKIDSVQYADGSHADFEMEKEDPILGSTLKIKLKPDTKKVKIFYTTEPDATALQWLEASQTFGKKAPYLFTQGESIYTRTWIPSPDSPGTRISYDATVTVPKGLMALMSAENPQKINPDGVYHFKMEEKIPSYLIALAVGDIAFKPIDNQTGVYAEPAILDKAHWEFADMGKMVDTAEKIYGKFRWGRYDVLILPLGFPFGGMENPRLTFVTPTLIAGDRSLTNVIAHELAHSWSGNLVTNATWDDFWLNEGFTVYFERRISEALYGKDFAAMLWDLGRDELMDDLKTLPQNLTSLKVDLKGKDPDDGFTNVPYDKGAAFLLKIEQTVGRPKWDEFVKNYFNSHAFQGMTTEKFLDYLNKNLLDGHEDWKNAINVKDWVYASSLPTNYPSLPNPLFEKVDQQAKAFTDGTLAKGLKTENWSTSEWLRFLGDMPSDLNFKQMKALDDAFHFTKTGNSEIADVWFQKAIQPQYTPAYEPMKQFLYVTGRMKFLNPLYTEMMKTTDGQKMAREIYKIAKPNYHPLAQKSVEKILNEK